jgi:hypothetical protein
METRIGARGVPITVASRRTIGSRGDLLAKVRISRQICGSAYRSFPCAWQAVANRARSRWWAVSWLCGIAVLGLAER